MARCIPVWGRAWQVHPCGGGRGQVHFCVGETLARCTPVREAVARCTPVGEMWPGASPRGRTWRVVFPHQRRMSTLQERHTALRRAREELQSPLSAEDASSPQPALPGHSRAWLPAASRTLLTGTGGARAELGDPGAQHPPSCCCQSHSQPQRRATGRGRQGRR
jgi:hypothetical protein